MNKYGITSLLVLVCIAVASCVTQKKPTRKPTRKNVYIMNAERMGIVTVDTFGGNVPPAPPITPGNPPTPPVVTENDNKVIESIMSLLQRKASFKTFSGKAKMHFTGLGQNQQFSANIRIKKDEIIWINISALGGFLPVARIYITPDSFQMINSMQKEAMKLPIAEAVKVLPAKLDFSMLQNLLIGDALKTTGTPVTASDKGGSLRLQITAGDMIQEVTYNKADSNMRSLQMRTTDNRTEGMIQYGNYGITSGRSFATSRAINLSNAGEPYYLDMDFSSAEFDTELEFPFSIPKSYKLK